MIASTLLQDSGPTDSRLIARLLQAGTLLIDERDHLRFASSGACELLGARDETALRDEWNDLVAQFRVAQWPRNLADGETFHGRADVQTRAGARAIRYEVHAIANGSQLHRAVLVRDRARLLPSDRALLLASEAEANRHVLTGLVHAAKGPLNNFNLTLALLSASLARNDASPDAARRKRYLEVLQSEAARLAACIHEIQELTVRQEPSRAALDLGAIMRDCARVLTHDATMRDVRLDLDIPDAPMIAMGDPQLVRLALLSLAISVIELTSPGGRVGWRAGASETLPGPWIAITTSQPALPHALAAALFRLSCTAESEYSAAIAARLVVEAQGGDVELREATAGSPAILVRMPGLT